MGTAWFVVSAIAMVVTVLLLATSARILADQDDPYARQRGERPRG